jgi:hypothetical protein
VSAPVTVEHARSVIEDLLDLQAEARAWAKAHREGAPHSQYLEATRRLLAAIDALDGER